MVLENHKTTSDLFTLMQGVISLPDATSHDKPHYSTDLNVTLLYCGSQYFLTMEYFKGIIGHLYGHFPLIIL